MNSSHRTMLTEMRKEAKPRRRVTLTELCRAFGRVFPAVTGLEQRARIRELIDQLATEDALRLPVGAGGFDSTAQPPLPTWVLLAPEEAIASPPDCDPTTFPWAPPLRFATALRDHRQIAVARRIHEFVVNGGAERLRVPIKERSVELFGEEKRLDELRKGALFGSGRLTLDLLRCYVVNPPLVWAAGPRDGKARAVLVVENHSTYDSFLRWNHEHGQWAAVAYGNGDSFETSSPYLRDLTADLSWDGRVLYFGDVDVKGLLIPVAASLTAAEVGIAKIEPHIGCYHRLLQRAASARLPIASPFSMPQKAKHWLGEPLATLVAEWFSLGVRVPQELVGYEELIHGNEWLRDEVS